MHRFINVDRHGEVALLTLNRPERLNAWHRPMREEFSRALGALELDPDVRAIVLTGAGERAFSAGQDLVEAQALASAAAGEDWIEEWHALYRVVRAVEKPVVAALNGLAAGAGFQLALLADVRVGHAGTRMGQPEINAGIPSTIGPWIMAERLGLSRTVELVLTGRMMDGEECHRVGLIHYLVPRERVLDKAIELARRLGAKPEGAIPLNKRRFREMTEAAFADARRSGRRLQAEAFASGEPQRTIATFFAERVRRKAGA